MVRGTERDARRVEARMLEEAGRGELAAVGSMTLAALAERWLDHVAQVREPATLVDYRVGIRRALAQLGHVRLERLTPLILQRFFDELQTAPRADGKPGSLSPETIAGEYRALRACLGYAVRMGVLGRNPLQRVSLPKRQAPEKEIVTPEDLRRLLDAARGSRWHALWHTAAHTGLRLGELGGLEWRDVDWRRPALLVRRSLKRNPDTGRWYVGDVKSHERRVVILDPVTADLLDRHRADQAQERARATAWEHPELVFPGQGGRYLSESSATHALQRLCAQLGLPRLNMHRLRHIHGSHLLAAGWDLAAVSERLGHASVAITAQVYAHALPRAQERYIYPNGHS
ncbi:MAG: tyrosine-type recombinase/integrase [Sphaerobacter sp.]|nr:tyrosine-type recombinase/integrase [Sphaerobacter sp.]